MFCPKCGAQNKDDQKFCRGCGQSLPAVRMALEGKIEEATQALTKDFDKLASGAVTLIIFASIALAASFFSKGSAIFNLVLGLLIAAPMIFVGMKRLQNSIKLLDPKEQPKPLPSSTPAALPQPEAQQVALPSVPDTDPLAVSPGPASVTEHTTFQLKQPK
ncbi:MAG: zinc-ribbon domain-containing protein [Blastocatellia bacterium]